MERAFYDYFNKTKTLAHSVFDKFVPKQQESEDIDNLETITSSDEGEIEDDCISSGPEKSFNIDTIFSVPESDDEKSAVEVLQPFVKGQIETRTDIVDSLPNVNISQTPNQATITQDIEMNCETECTQDLHEKDEHDVCEIENNGNTLQHDVDDTDENSELDQLSSLTADDLDSLEEIMTRTCLGQKDTEVAHEEDNITKEKNPSSEKPGKFLSSKPRLSLRIFLFGKTGAGKSSTANTILGSETFQTSKSFGSITTSGKRCKAVRFGYELEVIDTPGLLDNRGDDSSYTENEILRSAILCSPGFHAALFIMQYGRITQEDELILQTFKKFFGDKVLENAILVFTGVDTTEDEEILQQDVLQLSLTKDVQEKTRLQQELLQCFGYKYFVMRNRGSVREREDCAHDLIKIIAKFTQNGQGHYTSSIFRQLEEAFNYMVRDDEVSYLLDICKEQIDFTDEIALLQLVPKVQVDFLYEMLQYSAWLQTYMENGTAWKEILVRLRGRNSAELNLQEIEMLKEEQNWRQCGLQKHKNFMEAIRELQMHHDSKFGTRALIFQKRVAEIDRHFDTKCTKARETMKCEAETSLKSFLTNQGWDRLISSGLVVAAVGGGVIAFGPLLGTILGASVATKVVALASAAYWGFMRWTK